MRVTFKEVSLTGHSSALCAGGCGRRLQRSRRFYQTLNPFNKLPDGTLKSADDIYEELKKNIAQWKQAPVTCKHCPEPAMLCKIGQPDGGVSLIAVGGTEEQKKVLIDAEIARMEADECEK